MFGQNTIYFQKFDVNPERGWPLFWHQYMTSLLAPSSEARILYNSYSRIGILNDPITFVIPIYENMPEIKVESPNVDPAHFVDDNTRVFPNVAGNLNIRTGPGTTHEILTTVNRNDVLTRIRRGTQTGELWDRVILPSGKIGYASQSFLEPMPEAAITDINLSLDRTTINNGERIQLYVEIFPEEAKLNRVTFSSSNTNVAVVTGTGEVTGINSGTATITATSENGNVSRSVDITVYTPVTDININTGSITLREGESFTLNAIITPENATNQNVNWSSSNENVATVNSSGNITAISAGTSTITVTSANFELQDSIEVTVRQRAEGTQIIFDESLKINGNIITGLDYRAISVQNVRNKITTNLSVEMYNYRGEFINYTQNIGTGGKILFKDELGQIIYEYNVVLFGDVTGDGRINSIDLLVLQRHILRLQPLNGLFLKAANTTQDGRAPSSVDLLRIQRHILRLQTLPQ